MPAPLLGLLGVGLAALGGHAAIKPDWERRQRRKDGAEAKGLLAGLDDRDDQASALLGGGLLSPQQYMQYGFGNADSARDFGEASALNDMTQAGAMNRQKQQQGWLGEQNALLRGANLTQLGNVAASGGFDVGAFTSALSTMESGGDYAAIGPDVDGDNAYGKYQIMGKNIRPWTARYLGEEMSPEAFVANKTAQDSVYQAKMGELLQKYGPADALSIWHSGVPLKQAIAEKRHDGNMSTEDYVNRVMQAYGRNAGQNAYALQQQQAVTGAVLGAGDAAAPYQGIVEKADTVLAGIDDFNNWTPAQWNSTEAEAVVDQMNKATKELFFEWKKEVYGEAEPNPTILKELESVFVTPGGWRNNPERTRRFYVMMKTEAQKMAQYKSTRALVEAGLADRNLLIGMNNGTLTAKERFDVLNDTTALPPGEVDVLPPVSNSGVSPGRGGRRN